MDLPETTTHSFIVKVWLERPSDAAGPAQWRGHITHVPGGERRYVQDLDDVVSFMLSYLDAMGIPALADPPRLGWWARLRAWLRRWLGR